LRVRSYRTGRNKIDGAVLTLVDMGTGRPVTKRKIAKSGSKTARRNLAVKVGHVDSPSARRIIYAAMKQRRASSNGAALKADTPGKNGSNAASVRGVKLLNPTIALEAAVQRFVELYDFAPIAYVSFDRVGRIEEVNFAAAKLLGKPRKTLLGQPFALCIYKADAQEFLRHLLFCRTQRKRVETNLNLRGRNDEPIPVTLSSSPTAAFARNGVLLYQTVIFDLRARKKTEAELRRREERYRTLFDLVPVAVYTCDAEGCIQEFNQRAVELWGRQPNRNGTGEKFCGSFKIFYPDGKPMPHQKCPMARALRGETLKQSDLEILVEQPSGARRNVIVNPKPLRNERGKIVGAINCLYDFTEDKRAEAELRDSEQQLRAIIDQTTAGMGRTDLEGRLTFVNDKFCQMLGYKKEELIGKSLQERTHPDDFPENMRLFKRMVTKGVPYEMEKRYIRKDGSSIWANVSASPIRNAAGKPQSAVMVVLDISDRKKAEHALREAKLLLETRVRERTAELLAANQELQNEIAQRKRLEGEILEISDREQRRLGQDLHDSLCQHLTATAFMARAVALRLRKHRVIEVKDIEKIADFINEGVTEARTISRGLHPVEMDAAGLVTALRTLTNRERGQTQCRVEADENIEVADPTVALHLFRIAREAVNNAYKHARAREILVRMRASRKFVELTVRDDGIGLPPNFRDGTGMGFHIMNYRARSIGAQLEMKSENSHGASVICRLPRK
jgi:PAS domain S-box-containing protein